MLYILFRQSHAIFLANYQCHAIVNKTYDSMLLISKCQGFLWLWFIQDVYRAGVHWQVVPSCVFCHWTHLVERVLDNLTSDYLYVVGMLLGCHLSYGLRSQTACNAAETKKNNSFQVCLSFLIALVNTSFSAIYVLSPYSLKREKLSCMVLSSETNYSFGEPPFSWKCLNSQCFL